MPPLGGATMEGRGGIITTGPYLTTADGQSCFTQCMRERGAPVISAQSCEFSVPNLSCSAFPRSCIKFAFSRTRVPKMPGARERKTRNARPSLVYEQEIFNLNCDPDQAKNI